jgi:hypothetical protein
MIRIQSNNPTCDTYMNQNDTSILQLMLCHMKFYTSNAILFHFVLIIVIGSLFITKG